MQASMEGDCEMPTLVLSTSWTSSLNCLFEFSRPTIVWTPMLSFQSLSSGRALWKLATTWQNVHFQKWTWIVQAIVIDQLGRHGVLCHGDYASLARNINEVHALLDHGFHLGGTYIIFTQPHLEGASSDCAWLTVQWFILNYWVLGITLVLKKNGGSSKDGPFYWTWFSTITFSWVLIGCWIMAKLRCTEKTMCD